MISIWPFKKQKPRVNNFVDNAAEMVLRTVPDVKLVLEFYSITEGAGHVVPKIYSKDTPEPLWAGNAISVRSGDSVTVPPQMITFTSE